MMNNEKMELEIEELNAMDTKCFNATVNGIRAGGFINFTHHFDGDFEDFFKKCYIKNDNGKTNLDIAHKRLSLVDLRVAFETVLSKRKEQLQGVFSTEELKFEDLDDLEKRRYLLLYAYGDKLGGYNVVASLSLIEIIKIDKFFNDIRNLGKKKDGK